MGMVETIRNGLTLFKKAQRDQVLILFSAHSLPMSVIKRGDPFVEETKASIAEIVRLLNLPNQHRVSYQSAHGPIAWQGPSTTDTIRQLGKCKTRNVLLVPISFISDHIETLYEIDVELRDLATRSGIEQFKRTAALNDLPIFIEGMANLVSTHLASGEGILTF